jgi:hypothetical protein
MVRQTFGIEKPRAKIGHRAEMNDRLKSGSGEGDVNGRLWVRLEAGGQGVFAQTRTFRLAIRAPNNGHSLSAIFPVSPSPIVHFGKNELGTDFGKA